MGSAKTANADRSATLTNPPPIPSFSLTSRLYVPQFATFLGTATGLAPTKANRRDETTRAVANFAFSFFFHADFSALDHNIRNKVARISNYEETLNDLRRDNYFSIVGSSP